MYKKIWSKKKDKLIEYCDPGICDHCQYIGEGDFLCDKYMEVVISDWRPTDKHTMCRKGRGAR